METTTVDSSFTVTDAWLDHFRPRPGSSWTQDMVLVLDTALWPRGRRSPVAGWRDLVRGRVISETQRRAFEAKVREAVRREIEWHAEALIAAQRRLASLDVQPLPDRPEVQGWASWEAAPGVM